MDVKVSYTNSSVPSFERILVESTINASMLRSTGTVCCEASSNGDRSSAFLNFAIKGNAGVNETIKCGCHSALSVRGF